MMMVMYGFMCAILLGVAVVLALDVGFSKQMYALIRSNARLPVDATTVAVNAVSLVECCVYCLQLSSGCNGFNYNSQTLQCELMQQSNINEASLQSMSDFSFYRKVIKAAITTTVTSAATSAATTTVAPNPCENGGNVTSMEDSTCSCVPGYRGTRCQVDCTKCRIFNGYSLEGFNYDSDTSLKTDEACWDACRKVEQCYTAQFFYFKTEKKYECFFKTIPFQDENFALAFGAADETNVLHTVCAFDCLKP